MRIWAYMVNVYLFAILSKLNYMTEYQLIYNYINRTIQKPVRQAMDRCEKSYFNVPYSSHASRNFDRTSLTMMAIMVTMESVFPVILQETRMEFT